MVEAEIDLLFRAAVHAIDGGDISGLERLLAEHPELVRDRLEAPGGWLRERVGGALDGFFQRPYLLWFVAEDPVRQGKLPQNIAEVARAIIDAARQAGAPGLQEQLDYALRLVSWSWIARDCGVQIELIDALVDAGAALEGTPDSALVNGNVEAARHLVQRGASLTFATALVLGRWDDATRLASATAATDKQMGFVLAALNGNPEALQKALDLEVEVNRPSEGLYSHATPLHHAVCSGSLQAVRVLVEAGADLSARDTAWDGTPLEWAEHYASERGNTPRHYGEIAEYLRTRQGR